MSIIKNKLIQMILAGSLCAFILGIISFLTKDSLVTDKTNFEKQIIIIDVNYKNKINEYVTRLNEIGYLERTLVFSQEFYKSLDYIKLRYENNNNFNNKCFSFSMNLTDNSIFLETHPYPINNKENMNECLTKIFDLSFERLKEKLDIFNYRALTLTKFQIQEEDIKRDKLKFEDENISKNIASITKEICTDLDKILREDLMVNPEMVTNNDPSNFQESFLSIFTYHQNLIAAKTLEQFCEIRSDSSKKKEFLFHLNELNTLITNTKFDEIYKVEKIYKNNTKQTSKYLSTKNVVFTFSIFGFIFGVFLVYNFRSLNNKNE